MLFKEWNIQTILYFEKETEACQLIITDQFVRVDCYGMTEYSMNKVIVILDKYNCPLYDSTMMFDLMVQIHRYMVWWKFISHKNWVRRKTQKGV